MSAVSGWLDDLAAAATSAAAAEQSYRDDFARRVAELAEARAVAFRRSNLMRAIADALTPVESKEAAVAHGLAVLRARLGWSSDSEAREEILSRFAPVCAAAFASQPPHPEVPGEAGPRRTQVAGASFEAGLRPAPQDEEVEGVTTRPGNGDPKAPCPAVALAAFEAWYLAAKGTSFWILFDNVMPETPRVDW